MIENMNTMFCPSCHFVHCINAILHKSHWYVGQGFCLPCSINFYLVHDFMISRVVTYLCTWESFMLTSSHTEQNEVEGSGKMDVPINLWLGAGKYHKHFVFIQLVWNLFDKSLNSYSFNWDNLFSPKHNSQLLRFIQTHDFSIIGIH